MNKDRYLIAPGSHLGSRFLWLVAVPTVCCFLPWGLFFLATSDTVVAAHVVSALLPLIGLTCVAAYRWITRDQVRLVPYIPVAFAAVVFAVSMIALAVDISREPDGAVIPILPYGLGILLPFASFFFGLVAFILVGPRNRA